MVCAVRNLQVHFLVWVSHSKLGAAISAIISLILARISCFRWTNKSPAFTWKDMGYRNQKIRVSKLSTHSPAFTWKDMGYRNQSVQVRKLSTCAPACTWQGYGACDWPCGKHFSLSRGSLSGWWCFYLAKSALKHLIMILYHVHPSKQSTSADIFPPHAHQRERSDKVGIPSAYIEVGMPAIYDVG